MTRIKTYWKTALTAFIAVIGAYLWFVEDMSTGACLMGFFLAEAFNNFIQISRDKLIRALNDLIAVQDEHIAFLRNIIESEGGILDQLEKESHDPTGGHAPTSGQLYRDN